MTLKHLRNRRNLINYCKTALLTGLFLTSITELKAQCNTLVWSDEFDGTTLNTTNWAYATGNGCGGVSGCGFGNNEKQYYTNSTNNVSVNGGNLVLTARYEANYNGSGSNYTSGKIYTMGKKSWKYGRFEARVKVPSASAIWPAFWMLPDNGNWPKTGEIDILETQNKNPLNANQTLHFFCTPCGNAQNIGVAYNKNINWSLDYHIYAVDWSPQKIVFSVDGVNTVTYTPSSLAAKGGLTSDWPFDAQNFYIIFNLAVGGTYTGNATPVSTDYPVSMLVDYVRVYTTGASLAVSGPELSFTGDTKTYTATDAGASATYNWTVPAGATIVSGQGTRTATVKYNSATSGNVSVTIDPDGAGTSCTGTTVSVVVKAINNTCALLMDDFENNRNLLGSSSDGAYNTSVANPSKTGSNTSNTCASYTRNAGVQYDILGFTKFLIGDPDDFRKGLREFTMDVRTSAPQGTSITIEFDKTADISKGWPFGRHSQYTATTGAPNTWTKLTFKWLASPDGALTGADVDKIQILFNPNSYTNNVYYIDNLTAQGVTPATSSITGLSNVCINQKGVKYSVTGTAGSTYSWTVPGTASIISGQGTNSIVVDFGNTGGNISVVETNTSLCTGATKTLAVTVAGSCALAVDFSATPLSSCAGGKITFTDLTTGKSGGETYLWNFGQGASPATSSSAGPINVIYSSGGSKTVTLTVTSNGTPVTKTKTNYINIAPPPTTCLFSDDYIDNNVQWIAPLTGPFSHAESGGNWNITTAGHGEWDNFAYTLNNGTAAASIDFSCAANAPVVKIVAKASSSALLRLTMMDASGKTSDNWTGPDLELTTSYQTFTIDFSKHFQNYYGTTPGVMDSSTIGKLQFFVNPGFFSYPITGKNAIFNKAFSGTINIDWIGIGNNCSIPGPTGINPITENVSFTSFPNPFKDETILHLSDTGSEKGVIKVMDLRGVLVMQKEVTAGEDIHIGKDLLPGMYIVQLQRVNSFKNIRIVKL